MTTTGPVILIGAPRSGAGMLARLLSLSPEVIPGPLTAGHVIDDLPGMSAKDRGYGSHRLTAADVTPEAVAALRAAYDAAGAEGASAEGAGTDGGTTGAPETDARITVDWNPRLGLRLGFLAAALPDARFVIVLRRPMPTIASLSQAWRVGRFASVDDLPGWWGEPWAFGLIPQWRDAIGVPPHEVCARQWAGYATAILDDIAEIDPSRWTVTSYERLVADPDVEVARITDFAGITDFDLPDDLPLSAGTITPPDPAKWRREAGEISAGLAVVSGVVPRYMAFRDEHAPEPEDAPDDAPPQAPPGQTRTTLASEGTPFSSKHTATFPELLGQAASSVIVSTYKSGHVIMLRRDEHGKLNTEFASYNRPMGIATVGSRLSIGTGTAVVNMSNTPALAKSLDPPDVNDAVFSTRSIINTGDVAIHEMAFVDEELWFVNTRFSCICTLDVNYSFVPRWRPPWISALAAEDRCHVNGFTLRDGVPRYATALSQTDTAHGWRELKGTAGLIIDITTNDLVTTGLAMPHSPRWHDGRLWVLESGKGSLATVDIATGEVTTIAVLPGFTRGLAFLGPYALIGLSQVRESVFKDLPVTQATAERNCGVWLVDTRTGRIEGYVKFEGVVQEIFDVQVLMGRRWPTILREPTDITQNSFVLPPAALQQIASASQ